MLWLWLFISGLILVIILLLIKIHLLRKSAKEIECSFSEKLITDSNTLIDISSNDKYMCHLANEINIQLRKLRAERRKFQKGDIELKNAVTNVSHDLRTPLTAIYGYLDLLEQEEKSEKVNRYIAVIKNRTEMLKQLTEELFRYSVILTSEEDLKIEPITINNVLEESIASFYTILKEKQISPKIILPQKKIVRNLDRSALSRIFANLLNNAVKYSNGDLEVTLFENGEIQTAVFTSASTVRGFVNAVSGLDFEKVRAACIGKQTKAEADSYGMQTFMAKEATIDSVTDLVVDLNKK